MLRLYDLRISKREFEERFGDDIESLRPIIRGMKISGILEESGDFFRVKRPFAVHSITKTFLETFISRVQEEGFKEPWPKEFSI